MLSGLLSLFTLWGFKGFELTQGKSAHVSSYLRDGMSSVFVLCCGNSLTAQTDTWGPGCSQTLLICQLVYKTPKSSTCWTALV